MIILFLFLKMRFGKFHLDVIFSLCSTVWAKGTIELRTAFFTYIHWYTSMTIANIYYSNSMGYVDYFVNKKLPKLMAAYKKIVLN